MQRKQRKLYSDIVRIGLKEHVPSSQANSPTVQKNFMNLPRIRAGVWNAQSLRQKTQTVKDFRDEYNLDLFLFTETWLKTDDKVEIGELERNGECFYLGSPREGRPGGGVGAIIKSGIKATKKNSLKTKTFEHMELELQMNGKTVTFLLIYRPEPSNKNKYTMSEFFAEFTNFLTYYQTYQHETVIIGDFNFYSNQPNDAKVVQYNSFLEMFDLIQHTASATGWKYTRTCDNTQRNYSKRLHCQ